MYLNVITGYMLALSLLFMLGFRTEMHRAKADTTIGQNGQMSVVQDEDTSIVKANGTVHNEEGLPLTGNGLQVTMTKSLDPDNDNIEEGEALMEPGLKAQIS